MKKILVVALLAVMGLGASAQVMTSRTRIKEKKETMWYGRIGLSINNVAGGNDFKDKYNWSNESEFEKTSIGPRAGMALDFGFHRPMGKSGCYWGMELGIGTRGGSMKNEWRDREWGNVYDEGWIKANVLTWNIKYSPFTFGYKYSITDDIKLDAHLGVFVSYDFAGKAVLKEEGYSDRKISMSELKEDNDYQAFDAGLQLGIGVWWRKFNFDITWQRGFVPAALEYITDSNLFSSNIMLRVGYAF